jgi:hypothetical protein
MNLTSISEAFSALRFPRLWEDADPARDSVMQLRSLVGDAFGDGEFLVDCIARELPMIEHGWLRRGLAPFLVDREFGVRFAFAYWRPGESMGPHEHRAWSLSMVCHNCLDVTTYDRAESYRRKELVPKNLFHAEPGQVGYIYGPAIHSPKNSTAEWSVSLHINSPRDNQVFEDADPLPGLMTTARSWMQPEAAHHPLVWVADARQRRQEADLLACMLLSSRSPRARELLAPCARLASSGMKQSLRSVISGSALDSSARLVRVHPDVRFSTARDAADCVLFLDTPEGPSEALRVNALAYEALAFASTSMAFEARELPGPLDDEERAAVCDAFQDIGLFRQVEP